MLGRACCSLKLGCKSEREARRGVGRSVERERENKSCTMFDAACTTVNAGQHLLTDKLLRSILLLRVLLKSYGTRSHVNLPRVRDLTIIPASLSRGEMRSDTTQMADHRNASPPCRCTLH